MSECRRGLLVEECALLSAIQAHILIWESGQMTMCNESLIRIDEPTFKYHQTLQFPSALHSDLASFS